MTPEIIIIKGKSGTQKAPLSILLYYLINLCARLQPSLCSYGSKTFWSRLQKILNTHGWPGSGLHGITKEFSAVRSKTQEITELHRIAQTCSWRKFRVLHSSANSKLVEWDNSEIQVLFLLALVSSCPIQSLSLHPTAFQSTHPLSIPLTHPHSTYLPHIPLILTPFQPKDTSHVIKYSNI